MTATSTGDPGESDSATLTTTANGAYGVELSADMAMSGASGTTVVYSVWITNTGNTTDTFDLVASGHSWNANHAATATLGPGESMMVDVMVAIPGGANSGDMDAVTVTATSQGDTGESDSTTLTTTATGFVLYLPFVARSD